MLPKLLYFVTEDWFFCSHFEDRALFAKQNGFDVIVVTRIDKMENKIRAAGFKLIPIELSRRSINPTSELKLLYRLVKIYRKEQPALVHNVAFKPIIYGSIAAKLSGAKAVFNAPVGMGYLFISSRLSAKVLKRFILFALRQLFKSKNTHVIVENTDDQKMLIDKKLVDAEKVHLIKGAGVDLEKYYPTTEIKTTPQIILPARMLWDKGVGEFVKAAIILQEQGIIARFVLVGDLDEENPNCIDRSQLEIWDKDGVVDWIGYQQDIPAILANTHIVCLPSYREGLPKSLIEAAAAGKPIVTTDVPGCREVVSHGVNGYLVPVKNEIRLADALKKLILEPQLRKAMGKESRLKAEQEFSIDRVNKETISLYENYSLT